MYIYYLDSICYIVRIYNILYNSILFTIVSIVFIFLNYKVKYFRSPSTYFFWNF